jgi:hypothetical protein
MVSFAISIVSFIEVDFAVIFSTLEFTHMPKRAKPAGASRV